MTLIAYHKRKIYGDSLNIGISPDDNEMNIGQITYKNKIFTDSGVRIAIGSSGSLYSKKDRDTVASGVLSAVVALEDETLEFHAKGMIELPIGLQTTLPPRTIVLSAKNAYKIKFKDSYFLQAIDDDDGPIFYGSSEQLANMIFAHTGCMLKTFSKVFEFDQAVGGTIYVGGCENLNPIQKLEGAK